MCIRDRVYDYRNIEVTIDEQGVFKVTMNESLAVALLTNLCLLYTSRSAFAISILLSAIFRLWFPWFNRCSDSSKLNGICASILSLIHIYAGNKPSPLVQLRNIFSLVWKQVIPFSVLIIIPVSYTHLLKNAEEMKNKDYLNVLIPEIGEVVTLEK